MSLIRNVVIVVSPVKIRRYDHTKIFVIEAGVFFVVNLLNFINFIIFKNV